MKLRKENGIWTLYLKKDNSIFIHTMYQWGMLFDKSCNWYDFTIIKISFEKDIMCPGYEAEIMFMGLGLRLRINTSWEETRIGKLKDKLMKKYN